MKSCLKVAYLKIAVIINAVTLGNTMRPHRLAARTLASHAGNRGSIPLGATCFTYLYSDFGKHHFCTAGLLRDPLRHQVSIIKTKSR